MPQRIALSMIQLSLQKYNYLVCLCVHHRIKKKKFTRHCHILKTLAAEWVLSILLDR